MKYFLLPLLFVLSFQVTAGEFEHNYDRFTQTNRYFWRSIEQGVDTDKDGKIDSTFTTMFAITSNKEKEVFDILFFFNHVSGEKFDFYECGKVDWLVDDKPFMPMEQRQIDDEEFEFDVDVFYNSFSKENYAQLVNAKKIEYRICRNEFVMNQEEVDGLKTVYSEYLRHKR